MTTKFKWKGRYYEVSSQAYTDLNTIIRLPNGQLLMFNGWKIEDDVPTPVSAKIVTELDAREIPASGS